MKDMDPYCLLANLMIIYQRSTFDHGLDVFFAQVTVISLHPVHVHCLLLSYFYLSAIYSKIPCVGSNRDDITDSGVLSSPRILPSLHGLCWETVQR